MPTWWRLATPTAAEIPAGSDEFSWETRQAVERLQAHLGVEQTGALALGQAVFLPGTAVRVTTVPATAGASAQPGQPALTGTSTTRAVTIPLDASQQSAGRGRRQGDHHLPNNSTTPGVVSSVGTIATTPPQGGGRRPSTSTSPRRTRPPPAAWTSPGRRLHHHRPASSNALVVPVDALLALAGGGYAVEVAAPPRCATTWCRSPWGFSTTPTAWSR